MFKQSPRRNQRSKGLKIKHVLQIGLLLGVCIWLLYQVKHSHDKKASFVDNALASDTLQIENDVVKLGRKDLPHQKEGAIIRDGHQKEDEEEEENKNEEEHNKLEDIETGGKGGEEDDLHRDELEKTEDEVNGKGDFDDKEVRDGRERNNDLKEHEDSQEDNKGEDNEKADELSQKESEEGKEDGEENDENGGESLEKVSEESNGKELNEKNEVEENNENEVEENKENSENQNADNETENQVKENESEMNVEEGKSSEEKEKEKEESKVEKEKSEEHEPELEQRKDNSEGRAEDKDGHIQQVVLSENQVQDGNDSHNQGAREENYKNDDASSAVVHEIQLLNESDSEHSENTSGEVLMENKEKLVAENENKGTGESNQENKDKREAEQENNENHETEQENKEYHESEQENKENHEVGQESKENHEVGQESKENPEREQESKENYEAEQESKESRDSEQENRETNEVLLENKENNGAEQENKENNETGSENKDENTDLNQIESASILNETQSAEKNNTSYSFMDTTLDSAHNQNELNPVLDAALNHTEKVATNEKFDSNLTLTTAEIQEPTKWNSTNDSGKVSSQVQTFSTNPSEGTENDDTSHHIGIGGNEAIELSNRVEKLESNEQNHVDSAKEDLPSTFSENKQNERTVDSRENPNADKISEGDEEASLKTNSGQEAGQHESGDSSLPEHENESREDLETLPESTIAGHKSEETTV